MSITAQQFYDLVALRFALRWDPDRIRTMQGKIYASNWLFYKMGIYDASVRDIFARDLNVANLFIRNSSTYQVTSIPGDLRDEVWSEDRHFLIAVRLHETFQRRKLLNRDGHTLIMTAVGQEYAKEIEDQYSSLFDHEQLQRVIKERQDFFRITSKARAKSRAAKEEEGGEEDLFE